jgi:membrane-associated protease RseP (regulator of RpoE activity)
MILNILAVILGIATIIGIHEACHMIVSKLFGVRVLKFSLGFGPVIFSKKIGDTSYELALLPLGGYIQCAGDNPEDNTPGGFFAQTWYKRALIALAGPVANLLLGFVMILGLLVIFKGWPILAALSKAWELSTFVIATTLKWIFGMLPVAKDAAQGSGMAGPIMVTKILMSSAKEGVAQFLLVLSLISLSLGLFNLFPIMGLDGGHLFLYLLEGIRGKKFSSKVYQIWGLIGLILLGTFMLVMCGMDIIHLLK